MKPQPSVKRYKKFLVLSVALLGLFYFAQKISASEDFQIDNNEDFAYIKSPETGKLLFTSAKEHYTAKLPSDWERINEDELKEFNKFLDTVNGNIKVEYKTGFKMKGQNASSLPRILIQQHNLNSYAYTHESLIKEFSFDQSSLSSSSNGLIKPKDTKSYYREDKQAVITETTMDAGDQGKIRTIIAIFIGKDGATQLNFYSSEADYEKYRPEFESIISSFDYWPGYKYDSNRNIARDVLSKQKQALATGFIKGAVAVIILGLLTPVFIKLRNRSKKQKK